MPFAKNWGCDERSFPMEIKRFKEVEGLYIEKIIGQERLAFAMSDSGDLYDLEEYAECGGYRGSVIRFYDFESGDVYCPFEKKRDVMYSKPVFSKGVYYFLQADYGEKKVSLYKYLPEKVLEVVKEFGIGEVNLYNLQIVGEKVHVISQNGEEFRCYYPKAFSFVMDPHETAEIVTDHEVILERWVEEGWDEVNDCATEDYRFYDMVVVRDFDGKLISEEVGSLYQGTDGRYWMA